MPAEEQVGFEAQGHEHDVPDQLTTLFTDL